MFARALIKELPAARMTLAKPYLSATALRTQAWNRRLRLQRSAAALFLEHIHDLH